MKRIIMILFTLSMLLWLTPFIATANTNSQENQKIKKQNHLLESSKEINKKNNQEHTQKKNHHKNEHHAPHIDGANISLFWIIPFVGILLSIALFPLIAPHFWHHHYGKVSLFWGLSFMIAFVIGFDLNMGLFYIAEVYLGEFIPFIILLLALFTVAGGIQLKGDLVGTPLLNSIIILIGTILASIMGTTGAAMLLIRPLIRANGGRKYKTHIIVFFIFLVANIGGSLTPLGDPPLFLGFLKGVSFFWTAQHMILPMLVAIAILLPLFFILDTYFFKKEPNKPIKDPNGAKLQIEGAQNLILIIGIIGAVVFSGIWHSDISKHADWALSGWGVGLMTKGTFAQVIALIVITFISLKITKKETREGNSFNWEPILEVGKLFATIFITMIIPISMLKAGLNGPLGAIISQVMHNGVPVMGANTYIGNAPNFMVKSIAEESGVQMPSFFGYMFKYSIPILIPTFIIITLIFFL